MEFWKYQQEQYRTLRAILPEEIKKYKCETKQANLTIESLRKMADEVISSAVNPNRKSGGSQRPTMAQLAFLSETIQRDRHGPNKGCKI